MANYARRNNNEVTFEIIDEVCVLSETEKGKKMLALVKWGDNAPKYEVRKWYKKADGTLKADKGVTLDFAECATLAKALSGLKDPATLEKGKAVANKAAEPTAKKTTTARKSTAKKGTTTANKAKEPTVAKAKEPTEALADALNSMSAADLLKILVK